MEAHHLGNTNGFITLISVLIAGAVGIVISISLILLGLNSSRTSASLEESYAAKALADACIEEALQQVRDATPFTGSGSLPLGLGSCAYNVTNLGGQNRLITATGTVNSMVRRTKVLIDKITPQIRLVSWEEVAD